MNSPSGNAVPGLSDRHRTHQIEGISLRNICPRTDASMKYSSAASDFDSAQDMQQDRPFNHCFPTNADLGRSTRHTLHSFELFVDEAGVDDESLLGVFSAFLFLVSLLPLLRSPRAVDLGFPCCECRLGASMCWGCNIGGGCRRKGCSGGLTTGCVPHCNLVTGSEFSFEENRSKFGRRAEGGSIAMKSVALPIPPMFSSVVPSGDEGEVCNTNLDAVRTLDLGFCRDVIPAECSCSCCRGCRGRCGCGCGCGGCDMLPCSAVGAGLAAHGEAFGVGINVCALIDKVAIVGNVSLDVCSVALLQRS